MGYERVALGTNGETIGSSTKTGDSGITLGPGVSYMPTDQPAGVVSSGAQGSGITLGPGVSYMPTDQPAGVVSPDVAPDVAPVISPGAPGSGITLGPGEVVGPVALTLWGLPLWVLALGGVGVGIGAVWGYQKYVEQKAVK